MWKNVFIESCILSALIFGGFYFNATHLKKEISVTQENFRNESKEKLIWTHISGFEAVSLKIKPQAHFSGSSTPVNPVSPISGVDQPPLTDAK